MSNICPTSPYCGHPMCIIAMEEASEIELVSRIAASAAQERQPIPRSLPVPKRISILSGYCWMQELLAGNDRQFFEQMRMKKRHFMRLIGILQQHCHLGSCGRLDPMESLGMFIKIVGAGFTYSDVGEHFQRSNETVSRHFHHVLDCMCSFGDIMIAPLADTLTAVPWQISGDCRYSSYFDGCVGAIDGTHVQLRIPDATETVSWVDRRGQHSTNILAVCDFDMCITFATVGKEGFMHDARLLYEDMRSASKPFPFPPIGCYYLADSGFPDMLGILTPYKNVRYHIPAFREANRIRNVGENFNYNHAALRSIIERTFGVIKSKWRALNRMSLFALDDQIKIVWASFALHNYCRRSELPNFDEVFQYLLCSEHLRQRNRDCVVNPVRPEWVDYGAGFMHSMRDYIRDTLPFPAQ